jgi:hypothetical protein
VGSFCARNTDRILGWCSCSVHCGVGHAIATPNAHLFTRCKFVHGAVAVARAKIVLPCLDGFRTAALSGHST